MRLAALRSCVLLLTAIGATLALRAQTQPAEPLQSGLVLRFDVNLVQMDAVVTGRDGRRVAGLGADAFEVTQDGKPQKITHFAYVTGNSAAKSAAVQRTMVVMVDDLFLEFGDFVLVRRALSRFIDEELRAGDLVALVCLAHGSGALQQFTSDPRLLKRAVERMYWRPPTGAEMAVGDMPLVREMRHVMAEMASFPGRKSLVLIAPGTRATQMMDVRGIADLANRTSVTIHTIDARGLPVKPPSAPGVDTGGSRSGGLPGRAGAANWSPSSRSQDTLSTLAAATGGMFLQESNGAFEQLREAAEDANGYYLIGWYPGEKAFRSDVEKGPEYHRVQIQMRDRNLRVRTREGYFGRPGTAAPREAFSAREQIRNALISPLHSADLEVRLTSAFARQEAAGWYVDLAIHVAAKGVRLEDDGGGCWKARLEVARALWPVDPGLPPNDRVNTEILDLRACGKSAERVRAEGFVAAVQERVPSAGAYQARVAVRNAGAGHESSLRLGSATEFLVLPDTRKSVAVAGLTMWSGEAPPAAGGDISYRPARDGDPAVRRFEAGEQVHYAFRLLGGAAEARVRVLKDGQQVSEGPATGELSLTGWVPGSYVLGLSAGAGKKNAPRSEQWIDFQIKPAASN